MNNKFLLLLALCAGGCNLASAAPPDDEARVIVKFKDDSAAPRVRALAGASAPEFGPRRAQAMSGRMGLAMRDGRQIDRRTQQLNASGISSAQLAQQLAAQPDVEYAEIDRRNYPHAAPNDTLYPAGQAAATPTVGQWYLRTPDSTLVSAINAEGAWSLATGTGVVVAVLDTGIRPTHPDLVNKLASTGYDFVTSTVIAGDGGGRDADPTDPGDYVDGTEGLSPTLCPVTSSSWHGTQTAGLVGAQRNNNQGIAGSGAEVKILPVRVLGKCGGFDSDIILAMRWAGGLSAPGIPVNPTPAKVLNLSFGSSGACGQTYTDTIAELNAAGVVVVVSAGNEGLAASSPANCPGAIGVAGLRHSGTKVGYSNVGPELSIAAPAGNCVTVPGICQYPLITTSNAGTTTAGANSYSDGNDPSIGTSFSSPLVAGTAALMISRNPAITPAQVRAVLMSTATPFPTGGVVECHAPTSTPQGAECYCTKTTCGAGMLNAQAAVAGADNPPVIDTGGGGGGGGAVTGDWLLGLLAGIVALHLLHLRDRARRKRVPVRVESQPRRRDR
jgi:serine protease